MYIIYMIFEIIEKIEQFSKEINIKIDNNE